MNLGDGILILLNGTRNPIRTRVYGHRSPYLRRLSIVFVGFVLDFTWGTTLPLLMFAPSMVIDPSLTCDDVVDVHGFGYVEKAQREVQQILVLSFSSVVLTAFPYIGAWLSIRSAKRLLATARYVNNTRRRSTTVEPSSRRHSGMRVSAAVAAPGQAQAVGRSSRIAHVFHALMCAYGVSVFVIILVAAGVFSPRFSSASPSLVVSPEDCLFPLYPWFTSTHACTTWVITLPQARADRHRK